MSPTARRIAGAAALIAGITVVARLVGFGRIVVFTAAIGNTDLGTVYQTANTVPNIVFEIVAGGALASLVVPLLAGAVSLGDRAAVGRTTSALLTWTITILVPMALVVAVAAEPVMRLLSHHASAEMIAVGTRMLRIFATQLPMYGVGIVLTGVLQAHHRFAWPALAPLLSSVTVIGAYALFAGVEGRGTTLAAVSSTGELVLSVGTTLGVAVLSLCLLVPLARLRVPLRPTFTFAEGTGARVTGLAVAGGVTVGAQQVATALVIYLANPPAPEGALVVYTVAQTVFFLPWAVLAVPVATSVYPTLASAAATGETQRYQRTLAGAVRGVLLLCLFGAAALVVLAEPAARVVGSLAARNPSVDALTAGIAWFAPGLLGYGLFALLSRALYARGDTALAARATVLGWAVVMAADLLLAVVVPAGSRVAALAAGNSVGMVVLGAVLLAVVARRAGAAALAGAVRAGACGTLAAAVAVAAGLGVGALLGRTPDGAAGVLHGMLSGVVVIVVFGAVVLLVDRADARPLVVGVLGRLGGRGRSGASR